MKTIRLFSIALIFIFSSGCINKEITGALNPKFKNYKLTNIIVFVENKADIAEELQSEIINEFNKRGIKAVGVINPHLFSSTDFNFFMHTLRPHRDKDYLFVVYEGAESTPAAFGSENNYGPNFKVRIGNFSGEKIWEANTELSAQGSKFISENKTVHETKNAIIQALRKDNLIP